MPNFLDTFKTLDSADPAIAAGSGFVSMGADPVAVDRWEALIRDRIHPQTGRTIHGRHAFLNVVEQAMSATDFPNIFGTSLNLSVVNLYGANPRNMGRLFVQKKLPNFQAHSMVSSFGGRKPMPEIGSAGYTADRIYDATNGTRQLKSYGKVFPLEWKALLEDRFNILDELPAIMAQACYNTEEYQRAAAFFTTTGWKSFTPQASGAGTPATTNLSISELVTAYTEMTQYRDREGLPIVNTPVYLVHAPGLLFTVMEILNSIEARDPGAADRYGTANTLRGKLIPIQVDWASQIITSSTVASKFWGLFAPPTTAPLGIEDTLDGYANPQVFRRANELVSLQNGSALERSFQSNSIDYRVDCYFGATLVTETGGNRAAWVSNGS